MKHIKTITMTLGAVFLALLSQQSLAKAPGANAHSSVVNITLTTAQQSAGNTLFESAEASSSMQAPYFSYALPGVILNQAPGESTHYGVNAMQAYTPSGTPFSGTMTFSINVSMAGKQGNIRVPLTFNEGLLTDSSPRDGIVRLGNTRENACQWVVGKASSLDGYFALYNLAVSCYQLG